MKRTTTERLNVLVDAVSDSQSRINQLTHTVKLTQSKIDQLTNAVQSDGMAMHVLRDQLRGLREYVDDMAARGASDGRNIDKLASLLQEHNMVMESMEKSIGQRISAELDRRQARLDEEDAKQREANETQDVAAASREHVEFAGEYDFATRITISDPDAIPGEINGGVILSRFFTGERWAGYRVAIAANMFSYPTVYIGDIVHHVYEDGESSFIAYRVGFDRPSLVTGIRAHAISTLRALHENSRKN